MNEKGTFEYAIDHLYEGADAALGGDARNDKHGGAHEFIDFDTRKKASDLYHSENGKAVRTAGGAGDAPEEFKQLVHEFNLLDMAAEVKRHAAGFDVKRRGVVGRTADAADLIIRDSYAAAKGEKGVSFEEFRQVVTGKNPKVSDIAAARAQLIETLQMAGYTDVTEKNLAFAVARWKNEARNRFLNPAEVDAETRATADKVKLLTQKRILNKVDFDLPEGRHLEDADLDGLEIVAGDLKKYSGFSLFAPRDPETGNPKAMRGVFAINTMHPNRKSGVEHLFGHEGMPGHHLQNVVMHLMEKAGKLGYEAKMGTMYTSFHAMQEGWAQTVWPILAGGGLKEVATKFGPDLAVELALIFMQDCAKNDASILHQLEGMGIPELQERLFTQYCLDPHVVTKMSGFWAKDKKFGGAVGGTYHEGSTGFRELIATHGIDGVLPVALHQAGFADMQMLRETLAEETVEGVANTTRGAIAAATGENI